jgi:eukaryotic-like serine/threonine-protein kinase
MKAPRGILWCPHCRKPHRLTDRVCVNTGRALDHRMHRSEERWHPLLGTTIDGKYHVERLLGEGGLGTVFEGENVLLHRRVAIKVVRDLTSDEATARLRREAEIIATLEHPNVCDIYDFGVVPAYGPFLVSQLLRGETIAARLKWRRYMRMREAAEIVIQVLSGLQAAHARNIVHRDVKPHNVFLVERVGCGPLAKLLDFGLAKDLSNHQRSLTRPGKALGTPQYMAPEQIRGEPVTPRTDLFAVGVMFYEMLAGRHPFEAPSRLEVQERILRRPHDAMSSFARELPDRLVAVVEQALRKDPAQRFQTAYAMQQALVATLPDLFEEETNPTSSTGS